MLVRRTLVEGCAINHMVSRYFTVVDLREREVRVDNCTQVNILGLSTNVFCS